MRDLIVPRDVDEDDIHNSHDLLQAHSYLAIARILMYGSKAEPDKAGLDIVPTGGETPADETVPEPGAETPAEPTEEVPETLPA